jgi:AcrR family transcriptional regulator
VSRVERATHTRRRYDSPVRRQKAQETRARIVMAGVELLHGFPIWNWRALTVRAVAERAGVNERTVYRYFPTERDLREAVLARLEDEVGVDVDALRLEDLPAISARILQYVSTFPFEARRVHDDVLEVAAARQRAVLVNAVAPFTRDWSEAERTMVAGALDIQWSVASYERLVGNWGMAPDDAIAAITWVLRLVEAAIRDGRRPNA